MQLGGRKPCGQEGRRQVGGKDGRQVIRMEADRLIGVLQKGKGRQAWLLARGRQVLYLGGGGRSLRGAG